MGDQPQETRDRILEAAADLFSRKGFYETSMSAIARKAGLGKGTLYWHFKSKDDLFNEMVRNEGKAIVEDIRSLQFENLTPGEKIHKFIKNRLAKMLENKKITQLFLNNENYFNQEFKENLFRIYQEVTRELEKIIIEGKEKDDFRPVPSRYAASALFGAIHGMKTMMLLEEVEDLDQMADFTFDLFNRGISKKGEV